MTGLKVGDVVVRGGLVGWLTDIRGNEGTVRWDGGRVSSAVLTNLSPSPPLQFIKSSDNTIRWNNGVNNYWYDLQCLPRHLSASEHHALAVLMNPASCHIITTKELPEEAAYCVEMTSEARRLDVVEEQLETANKENTTMPGTKPSRLKT
jgi:hypothetical protein